VAAAKAQRPDVFVAIDFPDFNFRVAGAMRRRGIPVVYYVSPQLWAWRPGRIRAMARFASLVLVIFPFEVELYERAGIPVQFVGHPLVDLIHVTASREELLGAAGLGPGAPTLALLPGSRVNELRSTVPVLSTALELVATCVPRLQVVVARAPGLPDSWFHDLERVRVPLAVIEGRTDDVLNASDAVITASGTATVQTALHGRPMVIVYKVSPLSYRLGRRFVRVDTFGMANLVAGRPIVPELIQDDFTADRVAAEAVRLLTDEDAAGRMRRDLADVRAKLGQGGASARAADAVSSVMGAGTRRSTPVQGGA
jgi:lipid-A-disaccharide synthase